MHPHPDDITQSEKSGGNGDTMSLAGLEHRLCPVLIERDGRNNRAPLFSRSPGEGLSTDQLVLARFEIDSGCSTTETARKLWHTFLDGTRDDVGCDGLGSPTLDPFLVEGFLEISDGILATQEGKELMGELMERHSISEEVGSTDKQIELVLWLTIV